MAAVSAWTCAACGSYNGGGTVCIQCGAAAVGAVPSAPAGAGAPSYDPAGHGPAGYGAVPGYGAQSYEPARWSPPAAPEQQWPLYEPVPVPVPDRPAPAAGRRHWWVVTVALLLVIVAGGGAAYALVLRPDPTTPTANEASTVDTPTAVTTTSTPTSTRSTTPPGPAVVGAVTVDPAVTDVSAIEIATVLNEYFTGINTRDYNRALSVYDPAGVIDPADPRKVAHFKAGVSTTTDTDVVLHQIGPSQTGVGVVQARVTFSSTQQPGYGPAARPNETCTHWDVVYTFTRPAGSYLVFGSKGTSTPC